MQHDPPPDRYGAPYVRLMRVISKRNFGCMDIRCGLGVERNSTDSKRAAQVRIDRECRGDNLLSATATASLDRGVPSISIHRR